MKFVNFGVIAFLVVTLCLGAQLSLVASALVPSAESAWTAASRAWNRIPARVTVPQRGYKTSQTVARVQQTPETTVRIEPRTTATHYPAARSMSTGRSGIGFGPMAGRSVAMSSIFSRRGFSSQTGAGRELTREEVINKLEAGVKDFSGFDLSNLDLSKLYFYKVNFSGANFTNANLLTSAFVSCDFTGANFTNANLRNTFFLDGVNLTNANLTGAALGWSTLVDPVQTKVFVDYLSQEQKQQWKTTERNRHEKEERERQKKKAQETVERKPLTKRTRANVEYLLKKSERWSWLSHKTGFDLKEKQPLDLSYSDLRDVDLSRLILNHVVLTGSDLTGANLTKTQLIDAQLNQANLTETSLVNANLTEANLTGVRAQWADFYKANLTSANCSQGLFVGAEFGYANLINTNFADADLSTVKNANLSDFQEQQWKPSAGKREERSKPGDSGQQQCQEQQRVDARIILGVEASATPTEIKVAYRKLALKWHPDTASEKDKPKSDEMMKKINNAFSILSTKE